MIKVIINADDFGINGVVTREIERMIEQGSISSTTIMANGECLDEVRRYVPLHPEISFGVHLCLSEFSSVTKSDVLHQYGLTDENGTFKHKAILRIKNFSGQLLDAIKEELSAQIEVVRSLGVPVSHADSHHHVHTIYPLKEIFAEVLKEHGIRKIRLGVEFNTMRMKAHLLLWRQRNLLNDFYSREFVTTSMFSSYANFIKQRPSLKENSTIELMCHPGHNEYIYTSEVQQLQADALSEVTNYKLISYNDLH